MGSAEFGGDAGLVDPAGQGDAILQGVAGDFRFNRASQRAVANQGQMQIGVAVAQPGHSVDQGKLAFLLHKTPDGDEAPRAIRQGGGGRELSGLDAAMHNFDARPIGWVGPSAQLTAPELADRHGKCRMMDFRAE